MSGADLPGGPPARGVPPIPAPRRAPEAPDGAGERLPPLRPAPPGDGGHRRGSPPRGGPRVLRALLERLLCALAPPEGEPAAPVTPAGGEPEVQCRAAAAELGVSCAPLSRADPLRGERLPPGGRGAGEGPR
ncbi:hypothetical protein GCM10009605_42660 [Nocardiopsis composta]